MTMTAGDEGGQVSFGLDDDDGGDGGGDDDGGGGDGQEIPEDADILDAHNQVRRNASPTPDPPLPDLEWDGELAASAEAWANRCVFEHSDGNVGENIYASTAPSEGAAAVMSWASEVSDYDYDSNTCTRVCGHYTQIVWRDSVRLGCGFADCDKPGRAGRTGTHVGLPVRSAGELHR